MPPISTNGGAGNPINLLSHTSPGGTASTYPAGARDGTPGTDAAAAPFGHLRLSRHAYPPGDDPSADYNTVASIRLAGTEADKNNLAKEKYENVEVINQ